MICPWRFALGACLLLFVSAANTAAQPRGDAAVVGRRFASAPVWVVGERHRVAAGHGLFAALVGDALAAGERVWVGLEIPADRQGALDAVLAGGGGVAAPPVIDCASYRHLLGRLGVLARAHPGRLVVRAIDAPGGAGVDRDRYMARAVERQVAAGGRVLVLVGNLHALKTAGSGRLAARLEASGVGVSSLLQLGTGEAGSRGASGVLAAGSAAARPALRNLARLVAVPGAGAAPWRVRAADAVIVRR